MCNVIQEDSGNQALQDDKECKNAREDWNCKYELAYDEDWLCNQSEYRRKQCEKTCGVCKSNKCENLWNDNECIGNVMLNGGRFCMNEDLQKNCMRTCGFCSDYCEDVGSYSCTAVDKIKNTPYGCNNPSMFILCKRSCGYCPASACENEETEEYCKWNEYRCNQSAYVRKKCKRTCGVTDC